MDKQMLPSLKLHKIDFNYIFKNYLKKAAWKKEWNIYEYDGLKISMVLDSINIRSNQIALRLQNNQISWESRTLSIPLSKDHRNTELFTKQLHNAVLNLISDLERREIFKGEEYKEAERVYRRSIELLTEIAENFLDSEGVTNYEIREAYIDTYVNNHAENNSYDVVNRSKYQYMTGHYLTYCKMVGYDAKYTEILEEADILEERRKRINKEIGEYLDLIESEEWVTDMEDELEAI